MLPLPILLISTKSVWGGAQKYVFDLATNLPSDRFAVTVLAGGNGPLVMRLREAGVTVIPIATLGRDIGFLNEIASAWAIFRTVRRLRPRIVHANGSKGATLGIVAARLARPSTRTIWTTHGVPVMEDRPLWQRTLILLSLYVARFFTSHVIAVSSRDVAVLRTYHIARAKRISYIPIALDIARLNLRTREDARADLARRLGNDVSLDGVVIGVIAEYTKNKGLTYLLDAMKILRARGHTPTTLLIGWGDDEQVLRDRILQNNLQSQVFLLPSTGRDAEILRAFDVFALTSVKEGLPYTILEAGAAGVAVLATRVGGLTDIITNEKEGMLVPSQNTTAIANGLERLIADEPFRTLLGQGLHTRVTTTFSLENEIRDTAQCYETLAR